MAALDDQVFFDSWESFIQASTPGALNAWAGSPIDRGAVTATQALDYARLGWLEGATKVRELLDLLVGELEAYKIQHELIYDAESTGNLDVARFIEGEPECWQRFDQVEVINPSPKYLRVVVNTALRRGVASSKVTQRGAAICALVALLEQHNRRVELVIVDTGGTYWDLDGHEYDKVATFVTIKHHDEPLDLPLVAYALAHPAVQRVHMFGLYESWPARNKKAGYGDPFDIPDHLRGDLYIERMSGYDSQWESDDHMLRWLRDALKAQDIELAAEVEVEPEPQGAVDAGDEAGTLPPEPAKYVKPKQRRERKQRIRWSRPSRRTRFDHDSYNAKR